MVPLDREVDTVVDNSITSFIRIRIYLASSEMSTGKQICIVDQLEADLRCCGTSFIKYDLGAIPQDASVTPAVLQGLRLSIIHCPVPQEQWCNRQWKQQLQIVAGKRWQVLHNVHEVGHPKIYRMQDDARCFRTILLSHATKFDNYSALARYMKPCTQHGTLGFITTI